MAGKKGRTEVRAREAPDASGGRRAPSKKQKQKQEKKQEACSRKLEKEGAVRVDEPHMATCGRTPYHARRLLDPGARCFSGLG